MRIIQGIVVAAVLAAGFASSITAQPAAAPAPAATLSVEGVILQRDGDTFRLLNATVTPADGKDAKHVDITLKFAADADGKVRIESIDSKPTSLVGADALVAGTYAVNEAGNGEGFELKGPVFGVDARATWSIVGLRFHGTFVAGAPKNHPQLAEFKGADQLPEEGIYGIAAHNRAFAGFGSSTKLLVNVKQVADTLVLTAYEPNPGAGHPTQSGVVVLKRRRLVEPKAE